VRSALFLFALVPSLLFSLSIEEKRRSLQSSSATSAALPQALLALEAEMRSCRDELATLQQQAQKIDPQEESAVEALTAAIQEMRDKLWDVEERWRTSAASSAASGYALWDAEETTLSQLVMEYGSSDYLYIVPPEVGGIKLTLHSQLPIPRNAWSELLEMILIQNGVGVRKVGHSARQLFLMKQDLASIQAILSSREQLHSRPAAQRALYLFTPPAEQLRTAVQFFEKFADNRQTSIQAVGGKVAIVASCGELERLLALYHAVWEEGRGKVSRVVPITRMPVKEMEKVLLSFFGDPQERGRPPFPKGESEGLTILPSSSGNHLILLGQREVVDRAEKVVRDTEQQMQNPAEMTIFLYECRHSDPIQLAEMLQKVYVSLLTTVPVGAGENVELTYSLHGSGSRSPPDGYAASPPLVVQPPPLRPGFSAKTEMDKELEHFIPDPKTGSILMAVRKDSLLQIKELLRKIDVPKKMVQIEVLLFEKKIKSDTNFGLNLLRIGSDTNRALYDGLFAPHGRGALSFLFHGNKSKHFPAFDITYSFLMTQEDMQLNAAPSVVTVNQTPATITIQDEISINNGAAPIDTNKGTSFEKSFTRQQYGINILITPFIHAPMQVESGPEEGCFVTLQTDITFDSPKSDPVNDRPRIERRHVKNEVRVADGETVILGGLRKKTLRDDDEKVPFLGEIPGVGKLFGSTRLTEDKTEMFICITPKVIFHPKEQLQQLRDQEVKLRPGDLPEFLEKVEEARAREQRRWFLRSMKIFFTHE